MPSEPPLPLSAMAERHPGLTPAVAEYLCEAARVCFDRHHESPVRFVIVDRGNESFATLAWLPCDERTRAAHANEIDATEAGAYACAIASAELIRGLYAVRRAETLTGADYYLAPAGAVSGDLEDCIRLEVSGTDKGEISSMRGRLSEKVAQAKAGQSNLPAIAAVVGFRRKHVFIWEVDMQ